jgi:hypothetical protein
MVAYVILACICTILGVLSLVRSVMQFRDRPGVFIFGVLCIVVAVVFFILVIVNPQDPNPNPLSGGAPLP